LQNKIIQLEKQKIIFQDLGIIRYKAAWDYQDEKVNYNLKIKSFLRNLGHGNEETVQGQEQNKIESNSLNNGQLKNNHLIEEKVKKQLTTTHYLLFCEHPPVYTLGKSGHIENVLLSMSELEKKDIEFFRTNRGGDITFHGLEQVVGYPILDLEKFSTDLGKYLRNLEEVIIRTIAEYGIIGDRSKGETGVWLDPGIQGRERKICALGIRCSRWVTMHGFALNVNTDLSYFNNIIPCGIVNKQVTSLKKELGYTVDIIELKEKLLVHFGEVFDADLLRN
jgi:lipoyl(octanoyl) transferase